MIATVGAVDLRRAAEFRADEHEGAVEHATLFEVADETGEGLIKLRGLAFEGPFDVRVMVPTAKIDGDHACAGLDEAASEQEALPGGVAAVFIAELRGFSGEVEGLTGLRRADELVGGAVEIIHGAERIGFFRGAEVLVHGGEESATAVKASGVDVLRRGEVADGEIGIRRIAAEGEGAVGAAHVTAALLRGDDRRDGDVRRQIVPAALLVGDDGAKAGKLDRGAGAVAGEHVVRAAFMRRLAMRDGADERHLVEDLGDAGELLADILTSDAFDGAEGAAILGGGEGFGVPRFMLGHATGQIDVYHRLGHRFEIGHIRDGVPCLSLEEFRQGEAESGHGTDLEEITAALRGGEEVRVMAGAKGMHFHDVAGGDLEGFTRLRAHDGPVLPREANVPIQVQCFAREGEGRKGPK